MEYLRILEQIKNLLREKFPDGENYVPILADILNVDIRTVHRKLRGDTQLTLHEALKISDALSISLDVFRSKNTLTHPLDIYILDHSQPADARAYRLKTLESYRYAVKSHQSTLKIASNGVPSMLYRNYVWLSLYKYLQWLYFNRGYEHLIGLSQAYEMMPQEDIDINMEFYDLSIQMNRVILVFHIDIIKNMSQMLLFFIKNEFVSAEEAKMIIRDYSDLLGFIENLCISGIAPGKNTEINIYYSTVLLPNDLTVLESDNLNIGFMYAFFQNPIVTKSESTFEVFQSWFTNLIRSSNIISLSNQLERTKFFDRQRDALQTLTAQL